MTSSGPLPRWLSPVSHVAAAAYGAAVRARARRMDALGAPLCAAIPVVSVGNVTAGGTGKTPFVGWCVRELQAMGHKPLVALRGYRAQGGRSDEAMEYQALLHNVPLAVGANRAESIARALAQASDLDCALLDDGFQHRQLSRALDIVLVDATRPGLLGGLLPAGWLREPPTALRRAGLVVVTRAAAVDPELSQLVSRYHGRPPEAWCNHSWSHVDVFECPPGQEPIQRTERVEWLSGKGVVAVAAIGNPKPFVEMLQRAGARVQNQVLRHDHARYRAQDARKYLGLAAAHGAALATTWKDWTKLGLALASEADRKAVTVIVPRLEIEFVSGESAVRAALARAVSTR